MPLKLLSPKNIFIALFFLIFSFLYIYKINYEKCKTNNRTNNYTESNTTNTYSDVKWEKLLLFNKNFEFDRINIVSIDYFYQGFKHSLIIRRDSIVGKISDYKPRFTNAFENDSIGIWAIHLLDILDENRLKLQYSEKIKYFKIHPKKIDIIILINNNKTKHLYIDKKNYLDAPYEEICLILEKIISTMDNSKMTIEELFILKNKQ